MQSYSDIEAYKGQRSNGCHVMKGLGRKVLHVSQFDWSVVWETIMFLQLKCIEKSNFDQQNPENRSQ